MTTDNTLSEYSQPPYILIGLESIFNPILTLSNSKNTNQFQSIFNNLIDCENYIKKQDQTVKIVLIVSNFISSDEFKKFQSYKQIDTIYTYYLNDDLKEEYICIYKRVDGKFFKMFRGLFENLWFLIGLIIVILFAYFLPNIGATNGPLYTQYTIKMGCVFLIFLLSSLSLPLRHLLADIKNYRLHLTTQFYNLIFVAFFVFGISLILLQASINAILVTGMILMGCMPTANSINIIATKYCSGNEAGTLLNILFGNIIGIFLSPALITMFMTIDNTAGEQQSFNINNYVGVIELLSFTVLLPILIGQIITFIWTEQMMWAKTKLHFAEINVILLLLVIWVVLCDLFQSGLLLTVSTSDVLIVMMFNVILFLVFLTIAFFIATLPPVGFRRSREIDNDQQPLLRDNQRKSLTLAQRWRYSRADTITFMFCGSTKTLTLGVPLITALYPTSTSGFIGLVTLPLVLYDVEQIIVASIIIVVIQHVFGSNFAANQQQTEKDIELKKINN